MILFDLDGTLLDDAAAVRAGVAVFLEAFRSDFTEDLETFHRRWVSVSEKHFQSMNWMKKTSFWGQRRSRMREIFGRDLSDEEADERFKVYLKVYETSWRLYPDTLPCFEALAGKRIGLITNGDGTQQRLKLARLGLEDRFSVVVISREVDCAKPEPTIFQLAAKLGGVRVEDCVYVGDRLDADALGSQGAGMRGIWLKRDGKPTAEPVSVEVIASLEALPALIAAR
jgi:putative hydrolase of the HAD superfamily